MKKAIADQWVKALRSGKYKQGQGKLYRDGNDSYCCLGVLCKISGRPWNKSGETLADAPQVVEWAGIGDTRPFVDGTSLIGIGLITLNDAGVGLVGPLTFDEIADVIQICWKEL